MPRRARHFCNFVSKGALMSRRALMSFAQCFFDRAKIFKKIDQVDAIKTVQESSQSEPSSRLFARLKISKVAKRHMKSRFGGAVNFWALPWRSSRKVTPDVPKFSSLWLLVEGSKWHKQFFSWRLGQNWLALFWFADMMIRWYDDMMIWRYDGMMVWWY